MNRLRRWLPNLALIFSAILLCGTLFTSALSWRYRVVAQMHLARQWHLLTVFRGSFVLEKIELVPEPEIQSWWYRPHVMLNPLPPPDSRYNMFRDKTDHTLFGFGFGNSSASQELKKTKEQIAHEVEAAASTGGRVQRTGFPVVRIVVPIWFVVLVSSVLPTLRVRQWLFRRKRVRRGLCSACGYDLRATPARCPECGAVPQAIA